MELREYVGNKILYFRKLNNLTQQDLAEKLGTTKQTISKYEKGKRKAHQDILFQLCDIFGVSINEFFPATEISTEINTISSNSQLLVDTYNQLHEDRQQNVLNYAKKQLDEQNAHATIKEFSNVYDISNYRAKVHTTAAVAAGRGYSYDDNEFGYVWTDRDDLARYDIASPVQGDSMEPEYSDGDIVLISREMYSGPAVYVVDYDGKSYLKKVYQEDTHFRLVSFNEKYDDIFIDLPINEDIYFNIVGRVVDSFTPVED